MRKRSLRKHSNLPPPANSRALSCEIKTAATCDHSPHPAAVASQRTCYGTRDRQTLRGPFNTKIEPFKRRALKRSTYVPIRSTPANLDKQAIPRMIPGFPPNEDDSIRKKQKLDDRTPFDAETFQ